jgi:uncharacterized protein (DUF3084 family)|tara:strand:- start:664 stop:831 length:168 start_codon:yes stop_codon:yes gene_type:complete
MNENTERLQTRIDMIRMESRQISYRIEALEERRKELQEQKKQLKELLVTLDAKKH